MGYIGVVSHLETIDPNKPNGTSKQWCPAIFFWGTWVVPFFGTNVGNTRRLFVGVVGERGWMLAFDSFVLVVPWCVDHSV